MMKKVLAFCAVVIATASMAFADEAMFDVTGINSEDTFAQSALSMPSTGSNGTTGEPDPPTPQVDGSADLFGGTNPSFRIEVGDHDTLDSIDWDIVIQANDGSFFSEADLAIMNAQFETALIQDWGGSAAAGNGGTEALAGSGALGLALTDSNGDGSNDFIIEFFESFDDGAPDPDTNYLSGTLTFNLSGGKAIPEPASAVLIASLGLACAIRRRR